MRGTIILLSLVFLFVGCGGDGEDCDVSGTYDLTTRELSGDCGIFPTGETTTANCGSQPGEGCEGENVWDDNCCGVTRNVTCESANGTMHLAGRIEFTEGGDHGEGEIEVTFTPPGGTACTSTYQFLYER